MGTLDDSDPDDDIDSLSDNTSSDEEVELDTVASDVCVAKTSHRFLLS